LKLKIRRRIYQFVSRNPGLHFREISRKLDVPKTTIGYHLDYLVKQGLIDIDSEKGFKRYYVKKINGKKEKNLLKIMRNTTTCQIILTLCIYPYSSQKDMINMAKKFKKYPIFTSFKKHRTTIAFHLQKLVKEDVLDYVKIGNETKYFIKNNHDITEVLIIHKKSLLDDISPDFLELLDRLHEDAWDRVFNELFEIFPNPFCC
jgi:predicted transcriptional regulator